MNPKEGLKIQAFKNAHSAEALADKELDKLGRYLVHIADIDFRTLHHKVRSELPASTVHSKPSQSWKLTVKSLPRP